MTTTPTIYRAERANEPTEVPSEDTIAKAIDALWSLGSDVLRSDDGFVITDNRDTLAEAIRNGLVTLDSFYDTERIDDPDSADAWASRLLLNDGPWWVKE